MKKLVRVPATTANLGPGFDTLGLALSVWNEAEVEIRSSSAQMTISMEGFGADSLPQDDQNLVIRSAARLFLRQGVQPMGLHFHCRNGFPGGSGLGSSSSAILLGLEGANACLPVPLPRSAILDFANQIEGHPDNVTPALLGGLTLAAIDDGRVIARKRLPSRKWVVGVVVPALDISTRAMREALPQQVPMADAVFNLSRSSLVVQAFVDGDLDLLRSVLQDRIHQPYRLPLIRGAADSIAAAWRSGLPAALSGAGPGVVVFGAENAAVQQAVEAMAGVFTGLGIRSWSWTGVPDTDGTVTSDLA